MKIFVISLQRSADRRRSISRQFGRLNLDFEFIDAVDGYDLSESLIREQLDEGFFEDYKNTPWLTEGVIGAALSHRIAYKKIIDEELPYALILEDDIIFSGEFTEEINRIESKLEEDRVITFFFQSSVKQQTLQFEKEDSIKIDDKHALYRPTSLDNFGSAAAYILSNNVARKMYQYQSPIRSCPDWWVGFHNNDLFSDIRLVFPLALKPGEFPSTINYHKSDMVIRHFRHYVDLIPLLRTFLGKRRSDRFDLYQNYTFV